MPSEGEEVLVTIEQDKSYGKGTHITKAVDLAEYRECNRYLRGSNDIGGFDTVNDWDEGQPIKVIAWMTKPEAFNIN